MPHKPNACARTAARARRLAEAPLGRVRAGGRPWRMAEAFDAWVHWHASLPGGGVAGEEGRRAPPWPRPNARTSGRPWRTAEEALQRGLHPPRGRPYCQAGGHASQPPSVRAAKTPSRRAPARRAGARAWVALGRKRPPNKCPSPLHEGARRGGPNGGRPGEGEAATPQGRTATKSQPGGVATPLGARGEEREEAGRANFVPHTQARNVRAHHGEQARREESPDRRARVGNGARKHGHDAPPHPKRGRLATKAQRPAPCDQSPKGLRPACKRAGGHGDRSPKACALGSGAGALRPAPNGLRPARLRAGVGTVEGGGVPTWWARASRCASMAVQAVGRASPAGHKVVGVRPEAGRSLQEGVPKWWARVPRRSRAPGGGRASPVPRLPPGPLRACAPTWWPRARANAWAPPRRRSACLAHNRVQTGY